MSFWGNPRKGLTTHPKEKQQGAGDQRPGGFGFGVATTVGLGASFFLGVGFGAAVGLGLTCLTTTASFLGLILAASFFFGGGGVAWAFSFWGGTCSAVFGT